MKLFGHWLAFGALNCAKIFAMDTEAGKMRGSMSQAPSNFLDPSTSDDSIPIEALETEVLALARAAKIRGGREADIQTFAKHLNNTVQNEMFGQLRNKSRKDMQKLQASKEHVEACAEFLIGKKTTQGLAAAQNTFYEQKKGHINCRLAEMKIAALEISTQKEHDDAKKIKETICGAVDRRRNEDGDTSQCNGNPNNIWIAGKAKYYTEAVAQWDAEVAACEALKAKLKERQKALSDVKDSRAIKKRSCDALQTETMGNECSIRRSQRSSNTAYESCYHPALNNFEADVYQVQLNVRKRKLEWRTLERISCLLLALVAGDGGSFDAKINNCIRQVYDGHQMNLIPPKAPGKRDAIDEIIDPCSAKSQRKEWAPRTLEEAFLLDCSKCPLPPTVKPTPSPTPPPPPSKFICKFSGKATIVHVRYGGFFKKMERNTFPQWNFPITFQEWNSSSEMEVLVANVESAPTLKIKCKYDTGPDKNKPTARWTFDSSNPNIPVTAAYGEDYDKAQLAKLHWASRGRGGYMRPREPSAAGKGGFGNFVFAPFCDVSCQLKTDDILVSLFYNGRAVPLTSPKPDNWASLKQGTQSRPSYQKYDQLKKFCFKFENQAKLGVEVRNTIGYGGIVLSCTSKLSAWSNYNTNSFNYATFYKQTSGSAWTQFSGNMRTVNARQSRTFLDGPLKMQWPKYADNEKQKYTFVKFDFPGNS